MILRSWMFKVCDVVRVVCSGVVDRGAVALHTHRVRTIHSVGSLTERGAWQHFTHPYPSEKDKLGLMRQTGLSKSQGVYSVLLIALIAAPTLTVRAVRLFAWWLGMPLAVSNWFINGRVRIWKPVMLKLQDLQRRGGSGVVDETGHIRITNSPTSEATTSNAEGASARAAPVASVLVPPTTKSSVPPSSKDPAAISDTAAVTAVAAAAAAVLASTGPVGDTVML